MRLSIADHFGWAVAVTASEDHEVVDRRRIELIELAELARARGWEVHLYDAKAVIDQALRRLGDRAADDVLERPRERLGPPWTKDHRTALAATIVADCVERGGRA
jgi:hypothetical protein